MKWISKIFLFAILIAAKSFLIISCTSTTQVESYEEVKMNLHVMAFFYGEVRIDLNGKNVFKNVVRPNPILGYAVIVDTDKPAFKQINAKAGKNHVDVWYNESFLADTTFAANDSTYLGISLVSHNVTFHVQDQPFFYW